MSGARATIPRMEDRSFVDANRESLERLRAMVDGLSDDALRSPANEYWSVAGVLAHMAWWDARIVVFAAKARGREPWLSSDEEPDGDWFNDMTRLVIEGLAPHAPRAAAHLAVRLAERADAVVADLPRDRMSPLDESSPIYELRADHRNEHLDELGAVLGQRG